MDNVTEIAIPILVLLVLILLVFTCTLTFVNEKLRYFNALNQLPGPKGVPIFGNALQFFVARENYIAVFTAISKTFSDKPLIRLRFLHKGFVFVWKTTAVEEFLLKTKYMPKADVYDMIKPWLGTGLLTSSGEKWQKHRKLLTPSFHFEILQHFMQSFNEQSEILVSNLSVKADGGVFNMYPYITLCTLDIICDTAMGKRLNAQMNGNSKYVRAVRNMGEIFSLRSAQPWLHPDWIFNLTALGRRQKDCLEILHSFTRQVICERKLSFLNRNYQDHIQNEKGETFGRKPRLAFLDTLLELSCKNNCLTDEEIREEVDTFMFEGHDTSSSCINWTLFLLGWHPDVQKKVHEELEDLFGNGDEERFVTTDDLAKLKYLEAIIKESLRLFPPIPLYGKRLTEDVVISGYRIPANTDVMVPLKVLHNDEDNFPDSEKFYPSRFMTTDTSESQLKRSQSSYLPFSAGPRNCMGQKFAMMEMKVILSHFLRRYRVVTHDKIEAVKMAAEPVLTPLKGINMSIYLKQYS